MHRLSQALNELKNGDFKKINDLKTCLTSIKSLCDDEIQFNELLKLPQINPSATITLTVLFKSIVEFLSVDLSSLTNKNLRKRYETRFMIVLPTLRTLLMKAKWNSPLVELINLVKLIFSLSLNHKTTGDFCEIFKSIPALLHEICFTCIFASESMCSKLNMEQWTLICGLLLTNNKERLLSSLSSGFSDLIDKCNTYGVLWENSRLLEDFLDILKNELSTVGICHYDFVCKSINILESVILSRNCAFNGLRCLQKNICDRLMSYFESITTDNQVLNG
ncbi:hypothetical protein ACOME3_004162 [Neoechinorhynchus agilis]